MKKEKFKSNFEVDFANLLTTHGINYQYEPEQYEYTVVHNYTPDFKITSDIFVETKGRWDSADRAKHLAVRKQNPKLQIIFCFYNPNKTLSKKSKTTYRGWCEKNGFEWCTLDIFSIRNSITRAFRRRTESPE